MKTVVRLAPVLVVLAVAAITILVWAAVPTTIDDLFLPGSQPGQSGNIEHPSKCDNCHGGYDAAVEPAFNWRGSMMSQAARDPLFYACLAIANQDAPDVGDLCLRCHTPDGWLGGRSIPTDGSALNAGDLEGVQCDFCHKLVQPTPLGVNPYPDDPDYTAGTYAADQAYLGTLSHIPPTSANGMYVADSNNAKRGPYVDAAARHQMFYSPFHREAALCGTCHDVSNPVYVRNPDDSYSPNDFGAPAPNFDPYTMFPIERTYSEWTMSAYNAPGGVFAPQFGGNKPFVSTCQDCHMRDVTGVGCNKNGASVRDDLPLHDMTGGNTFIPRLVAQQYPGDVDQAALDAGILRARSMLQMAATLELDVTATAQGYEALVTVTNQTGHKLPSGYPEGRRIWINLVAYDAAGVPVYESGAYDFDTGVLDHDADVKIYEIKPGISAALAPVLNLPAGPSFHFVLNNQVYSDNRIPPRGFTNANFAAIQSPVVGYSYPDGQHWDETTYALPAETAQVVATLYYQATSKEYVEFLRDENVTDDSGQVLYDLWVANGKGAPEVMQNVTYDISVEAPPVADFVGQPTSGTAPLVVDFTDLSSPGPTSWLWEFGDGGTSTAPNPTYTYGTPGVYTVTLTASNTYGSDTHAKLDYITVQEGGGAVVMHVADLVVTRVAANGNRFFAEATVTIVDAADSPVGGATVTGDFTGPTADTRSGTTGPDGVVTLSSRGTKNPVGEWCFAVTDVTLGGATYDPGANVVTQACESGPVGRYGALVAGTAAGLGLDNQPNPFNPTTEIRFNLSAATHARLEIFDVHGRKVATVVDDGLDAGSHAFIWEAGGVPSGVYLCRLDAGAMVETRRMMLVK